MKYWLGMTAFLFAGCYWSAPPLKGPALAVKQSMLDVLASGLPVKIAGHPRAEKLQKSNRFAPWLKIDEENREVVNGGSINLRIVDWGDGDGDQVAFWWECRRGEFTYWNPTATYVSWRAPVMAEDSVVPIKVTVSDGRGKRGYRIIKVTVKVQVTARDLVLTEVKYYPIVAPPAGQPPVYYPGEDVKVEWVTKNISAERFYGLSLCVWISTDGKIPNANPVENLNLGTYEPGESKTRYTNVYLPGSLTPGYYYLVLKADCENLVAESNEENNFGFLHVWVRPPGSARR